MADELRSSMRGEVITRSDPNYETARQVWNGLIDHHPALIAHCASTADVIRAVRVARAFWPSVSVRGGGHQVAGSAVLDDALVIDLSTPGEEVSIIGVAGLTRPFAQEQPDTGLRCPVRRHPVHC